MKNILIIFLLTVVSLSVQSQNKLFYDFKVNDINGRPYNLSDLKGNKVLVVNVASKCGLTPQYTDLQKLYNKYKDQHFVIIGFPANNFASQEPGTNAEIREFCTGTYNITFPMMAKISVKGDDIDPLYKWLTSKSENGRIDAPIAWNFQKFMIDERGNVAGFATPQEKPFDPKIINWIESKN